MIGNGLQAAPFEEADDFGNSQNNRANYGQKEQTKGSNMRTRIRDSEIHVGFHPEGGGNQTEMQEIELTRNNHHQQPSIESRGEARRQKEHLT